MLSVWLLCIHEVAVKMHGTLAVEKTTMCGPTFTNFTHVTGQSPILRRCPLHRQLFNVSQVCPVQIVPDK